MRKLGFVIVVFLVVYFQLCSATVYNLVGNNLTRYITSDKVVQSFAKGFLFFTNGIVFDGTVNVGIPVPINGNVQFGNAGTSRIVLETDLTLGSTAGTAANTIAINTTNGVAEIDATGGTITFEADTFLPSSRAFRIVSNTIIDGGGHDIVFGKTLTFSIDSGTTLTIRDAHIRNLQDLNFVGNGTLIFYNVVITLDNDWTFSGNASIGTPTLMFDDYTRINGKGKKFVFAGGRDMILISDAIITFDPDVTFSWASQRRYGLKMDSIENGLAGNGSALYFNGSNFYIPSHGPFNGLNLKQGSIIFDNKCNIYNEANTDINKSLQFGDSSSSSNNTDCYILGAAYLDIDGYVYDASA